MVLTEDPNGPISQTMPSAAAFEMPWEALNAIIQGKSSIDLTAMPVTTRDEAFSLIYNYGFDLNHPEDVAEIEGYFIEAVNFIEHRFLTGTIEWAALGAAPPPVNKIPLAVRQSRDVLDLILMASQQDNPLRPWACALLKVIHTLVFIQNSPLYKYHHQASETILSRFREVLLPEADGSVMLQGQQRQLRLVAFEAKHHKPRESILIKLLCKKENVAENIWDLVGVRLITQHPAEAILAVDILREQKVLVFPNVIPSRSRNTLIDLAAFEAEYRALVDHFKLGEADGSDIQKLFETFPISPQEGSRGLNEGYNPLSSPRYRSLHITCRQLLRVKAPNGLSETRFAFPYEIQIMDKDSFLDSKTGEGAHATYKMRQLVAARQRVLGSLLEVTPAEPCE